MKYTDGDIIIIPFGKTLRRAKIMGCQPNRGTYLVSVDHGNGGLHYVREEDILLEDQVDPEKIYQVPNRSKSWY